MGRINEWVGGGNGRGEEDGGVVAQNGGDCVPCVNPA